MRYIIYFFLLAIFITAGSCVMRQVHMNALQPALITVPDDIQNILLLDRSRPESGGKEVIGAILSASLPEDRKLAVDEALNGVQDQLISTPRFEVVKATEVYTGSNVSKAFPEPLPWSEIEELCHKYETDAIITLEVFTSRFLVTDGTRVVKRKIAGNVVPIPEFYANGVATAHVGFRLYDPIRQQIADQELFTENSTWEASGSSIADAMNILIGKSEAQKQVSYSAGASYASRISPTPIIITRPFYDRPKKSHAMTRGSRLADTNQWSKAIETWKQGMEGSKTKIAGRLAYNVAVAYEVLGELKEAEKWAGIAWVDFGNKKARDYSRVIRYRLNEQKVLDEQLDE